MRHPISFLITVVLLATIAALYVLLTPQAQLWVNQFPIEVVATAGASMGAVVILLTLALADSHRKRRMQMDWETARSSEARGLAAALRGEMTALSQILTAQADALEYPVQDDGPRSNLENEDLEVPSVASRMVYESNTGRLSLLGPDLATAIAYCHTCYEHAETQEAAPQTGNARNAIILLRDAAAKFEKTIGFIDSFISGKPVDISASDRAALFEPSNFYGEDESA